MAFNGSVLRHRDYRFAARHDLGLLQPTETNDSRLTRLTKSDNQKKNRGTDFVYSVASKRGSLEPSSAEIYKGETGDLEKAELTQRRLSDYL